MQLYLMAYTFTITFKFQLSKEHVNSNMKVWAADFGGLLPVPNTIGLSDFPRQELNLSGLGGSLLPFQVEAVRYAVAREGRRY